MTNLTPWTEEPRDIKNYRYMVRTGDAEGRGELGNQWPTRGYVSCDKWGSDDTQPWHYRVFDSGLSEQGGCCGLFGFLDGRLGGDYLSSWSKLGRTFQILTVDLREVEEGFLFYEHRVPRAWVRHSGSYSDVMMALWHESTPYSELVYANMKVSITVALERNRVYRSNPVKHVNWKQPLDDQIRRIASPI